MPKISRSPVELARAILGDWKRRNKMKSYAPYEDHVIARESALLKDIARHLQSYRETGEVEIGDAIPVIAVLDWETPSVKCSTYCAYDLPQLHKWIDESIPARATPYIKMPGQTWQPSPPEGLDLDAIWDARRDPTIPPIPPTRGWGEEEE